MLFPPPAERRGLSAAVAGGVCCVLREAHWCAVTGASEVSSNSYLFYTNCVARSSPKLDELRPSVEPFCSYHFDMFMLCVNAALIRTPFASFLLPPLPSPILQAGRVQLWGALAPQGGPGVPQHSAMAQCTAPLRRRAQQQHPTSAAPHQVLHYCLQVRAQPAVDASYYHCDHVT